MLLDLEKVYVIINVIADPCDYKVKIEITAEEIKNWLRRTGRKINKKWRVRDYLRENYRDYAPDDIHKYNYTEDEHTIDYVYKVHGNSHLSHLLVRQEEGSTTFAVKTKDGNVIETCHAGIVYSLCRNPAFRFEEFICQRILKCLDPRVGAISFSGKKPRKQEFWHIMEHWEEHNGAIETFSSAYYITQSYDDMTAALAWNIIDYLVDNKLYYGLDYDDTVESRFRELYYTDGTDMGHWTTYAEEHGLDPDDDDARYAYEDTCDEFAYARYKIDYDCLDDVKKIVRDVMDYFMDNYEF